MNEVYKEYDNKDYHDLKEMIFGFYYENPEGELMIEEKIIKTISESVEHPEKVRIIMICNNGINIGYGIIVFFWSNEYGSDIINIDELYIKKEYRNRGLATNFIRHLTEKYKNAVSLELETTPSNEAALKLYKKLGFEVLPNTHLSLQIR